jgi:hypothetical protein
VAEEWCEHRRRNFSQLHDASDHHFGQWLHILGCCEQQRWHRNEQRSDADCKSSASGSNNHHAASESNSDGGTDGDVHSGCIWYRTTQLSVAEERGEHRRSDFSELHHARNDDRRQRVDLCCGCEQLCWHRDEQRSDADCKSGASGSNNHHAASESNGNGGPNGDVHSGWIRHRAAQLSVAEEWCEYRRSDFSELHDASDHHFGQRLHILGCCEQQRWHRHK